MGQFLGTKKHPKGPDFSKARWLEFDFSGTKFRVKAPPHTEPSYLPTIGPEKSNIYDLSHYTTVPDMEEGEYLAFDKGHVEHWPFYGLPIFQGCLGQMSFSWSILKTTSKLNLFNPDQFEQLVHRLVDTRYKPPKGGWPNSNKRFKDYRVPLNWAVVEVNGTTWITYQAYARHRWRRRTIWLTPITDEHAINVSFNHYYHRKDFCCENAFQTLMDQITTTFEVKLSPQSQQEKIKAEQQWPDAQYSKEVPEREWSKAS